MYLIGFIGYQLHGILCSFTTSVAIAFNVEFDQKKARKIGIYSHIASVLSIVITIVDVIIIVLFVLD